MMTSELHFVRRFKIVAGILITLAIFAAFLDYHARSEKLIRDVVKQQARGVFNEMTFTRDWILNHGGVYVAIKPGVVPSPSLSKIPGLKTTIQDEQGERYTLRSGGAVVREVAEVMSKSGPYRVHVASLRPVNARKNSPDAFEREALLRFERGAKEFSSTEQGKEGSFYRYMAPFNFETR